MINTTYDAVRLSTEVVMVNLGFFFLSNCLEEVFSYDVDK